MTRLALPIVIAAALCAAAPLARADVLLIERSRAAQEMDLPRRGESMESVERRFGAPSQRRAPVGGSSKAQPPITRWDYPNFSVYFEYSHVVDAVLRQSNALEEGVKPVASRSQ